MRSSTLSEAELEHGRDTIKTTLEKMGGDSMVNRRALVRRSVDYGVGHGLPVFGKGGKNATQIGLESLSRLLDDEQGITNWSMDLLLRTCGEIGRGNNEPEPALYLNVLRLLLRDKVQDEEELDAILKTTSSVFELELRARP